MKRKKSGQELKKNKQQQKLDGIVNGYHLSEGLFSNLYDIFF